MLLRSILIVDDEEPIRQVLTEVLSGHGYVVRVASDGEEALRELAAHDYDAVVTDVRMPRMDGLSLVRSVQQIAPDATVIVMSAYGSHDLALEAMKAGAYDYLGKPFRPDEVLLVLRKAEERERLRAENRRLRREIEASRGAGTIVAESAAMKEVLRLLQKVAPARTTVLITGESGTGKELIARALHDLSPRAERPFVAVNCGAIPEQLIESELFGHAKGAFTGAVSAKRGLFEEADGGPVSRQACRPAEHAREAALGRRAATAPGLALTRKRARAGERARARAGAFRRRRDRTGSPPRGASRGGGAVRTAAGAGRGRPLREARPASARGGPDPPRARADQREPHARRRAARAEPARAALQDPRVRAVTARAADAARAARPIAGTS